MHHIQGRNYLHKYRQALDIIPKPHGLSHSVSDDKILTEAPAPTSKHRYVNNFAGAREAIGVFMLANF